MECEHYNERLSEYVDGTLGAAETGAVRQHLAVCQRCCIDVRELRAMKQLLGVLKGPEAPSGFWPRMYGAIRARRQAAKAATGRREWLGTRRRGFAVAMAAAMTVLLAFLPTVQQGPEAWEMRPDDLIALHALSSLRNPLGERGRIGFVLSEKDARDLGHPEGGEFHED
ncbi:MAG: zf-HC2 domain-containing protein [Armatimonadetes bacterium]|nr:zf-HC2 domain-containing protein [Armatimonadota bacterium]